MIKGGYLDRRSGNVVDFNVVVGDIFHHAAASAHGFQADSQFGAVKFTVADVDIADAAGHPAADNDTAVAAGHTAAADQDVLAGTVDAPAVFIHSGIQCDAVISGLERTVFDHLRERAIDVTCLGGSLDPQRFKGINKLVVKSVRSEMLGGGDNGDERKDMSLPTIMDENISQLADKIKKS